MKKISLQLAIILLFSLMFSGCGLSIYEDWQNSGGGAITGGGAVAGKDYINGLLPSAESRQYFAQLAVNNDQPLETVRRTDDKPSQSGVRFVKNGGIVIPPGVTISFINKGFCMDPHLPANSSGAEFQLVPMSMLIPEDLHGTYKKLMQKASAGDINTLRNIQHLVWALRTAGTEAAYANNLTAQQKRILDSCSEYSGQFEEFNANAKANSQMLKELLGIADSFLNINIGGVSYKASDLLDPDVGNKKINEHLNQLISMGQSIPVERSGFNYGEIQPGIYTDVRGTGPLQFAAKIANSTDKDFIFYPTDYIGQVGSGTKSQGLTFFATAGNYQFQRVTMGNQDEVKVEDQREPEKTTIGLLNEILGPASEKDIFMAAGDRVYQHTVSAMLADGTGKKTLNLLHDVDVKLKNGKTIKTKFGTPLDVSFGQFVADFSTSIWLGDFDGAASATEDYVIDATIGTYKTLYSIGFVAGELLYDLFH